MKVFLSYSRRDTEFVARLDHALTTRGYFVWTDVGDIGGGDDDRWRRAVVKAIRESDVVLLVLSPNSTTSPSVERELTVAADNSKRVVPVLKSACELPDGFQYDLAGIQYVDFTSYDFDDGLRRLVAQLGPARSGRDDADTPVALPADPTDVVPPDESAVPHRARNRTQRRASEGGPSPRTMLIAGAVVLVATAAALVFALTNDDSSDSSSAESPPPKSSPSSESSPSSPPPESPPSSSAAQTTSPSTSSTPAVQSDQEKAEDLVAAWADATTRRDFTEVARLDPTTTAEGLVDFFRPVDDPTRMFAVQSYIADATQNGDDWTLTGAAITWDYDPEPTVRSNVICSIWTVNLEAATVIWTNAPGQFRPGEQIPREQFPETYEAHCR